MFFVYLVVHTELIYDGMAAENKLVIFTILLRPVCPFEQSW